MNQDHDTEPVDDTDPGQETESWVARNAAGMALIVLSISTMVCVVGMLLGAIPAEVAIAVAAAVGAVVQIWYSRRR